MTIFFALSGLVIGLVGCSIGTDGKAKTPAMLLSLALMLTGFGLIGFSVYEAGNLYAPCEQTQTK